MTRATCTAPIDPHVLLQYWLRELGDPAEAELEEHFLGCDECSATLQNLIDIRAAIRANVRHGVVRMVVTDTFVWRLMGSGMRLRPYRVQRNASVHCTVAPDDDGVVARLEAPLADVDRLDVVLFDVEGAGQETLEDVPFDAASGEVLILPDIERLRELPAATARMQLVAVDSDRKHLIGEYTFIHTPWAAR